MNWDVMWDSLPELAEGALLTIELVAISGVLGLALAVPLALARVARPLWLRAGPFAYIFVFRGTPLLIQIFLVYYGASQFETVRESFLWPILREAYWCAIIAFTLNTAAYTTEIFRGAIKSTPRGEIEAARAYGMSRGLMLRRIVLPSAFRRALPAYGNEVIFMLHASAIASVVTIMDLTGAARFVYARYYAPFEAFLFVAAIYLCLTFAILYLFRYLERRLLAHLKPASG